MGYNKPNPLKMMESALKMYKAEKKGGMHRMESPMYAKEASRELKDMPIVDIEKGDAKGSPAKAAKPDFLDLDKDGNTILQTDGVDPTFEPSGDIAKTHIKLNTDGTIDINTNDKNVTINQGGIAVSLEGHTHGMSTHTHNVTVAIPGPPLTSTPASPSDTVGESDKHSKNLKCEEA